MFPLAALSERVQARGECPSTFVIPDLAITGRFDLRHLTTGNANNLEGVDAEDRATVQIRQRYDASVPRVIGEVARLNPVFVEDAKRLRR